MPVRPKRQKRNGDVIGNAGLIATSEIDESQTGRELNSLRNWAIPVLIGAGMVYFLRVAVPTLIRAAFVGVLIWLGIGSYSP